MSEHTVGGATTAIAFKGVRKSFGATHALKSVTMSVRCGSVHALVGENGAGKSTALGCIAGRIAPTDGVVEIFDAKLKHGDPRASRRAGVVAIYQELTIVPALSAEANVFLGQTINELGFLSERRMRTRYEKLCEQLGVKPVPAGTPACRLSVADQQVLEILRALNSDARIILFDEPTAALAESERAALHELIKGLRESGVTIVFVSHNLDEILDLADEITVFRNGELTVSGPRSQFTKASLVQAMVGREGDGRIIHELLEDHEQHAARKTADDARATRLSASRNRAPVLQASGITVPNAIDDLEIEVRSGEMIGIAGLVGAGRSTLLRSLAGLESSSRGRMFIDGKEVPWPRSVRQSLRYGIALVPEDRKTQGLVLPMSSIDNIAISDFGRAARWGFLSNRSLERATAPIAREFGFQESRLRHAAWQLSGGNQQKLLLARWKYTTPRILLTDEPTRGIDVGAKAEILRSLESMADRGLGLVMVSSELEEVALISDRVFVLAEGLMAGTLDRQEVDITVSELLHLAFRSREAA